MHRRHPTAAEERQWLDEVIHLHSLWRRGPPRNHPPPPSPTPPSRAHPAAAAISQNPENKINKRKGKGRGRGRRNQKEQSRQRREEHQQQKRVSSSAHDPPAVEALWPCLPSPTSKPESSSWPNPVTERKPLLCSADDQARADAVRVQESGVRASCEFFRKSSSSDDGDDDDDEEEEEDAMEEDEDEEDDAESRAFRFFLGLFEKNGELRRYYEKNWEKGEFFCLVCRATGMKVGKRFLNCVGLVQHSKSISKTKRTEAHRGFANAVCRVMGWDIERLPSIVLDLKDSLGQSLAKADKPQVAEEVAVNVETDKEVVGSSPSMDESLLEGKGLHEQSSSDMKEVVKTESNKQVPVSSSPLRDMEAFLEEGKHKEGPSNMTEEVPKEVVNEEGDKEDLRSSSPTGNMNALPEEEEKIHEDGSSDMNKEISKEIVDVETNKKDPLSSSPIKGM